MSFRRSKVPKFIPILSLLILLVLGPIVFSFLQNARGVEAAWVDDNFSYRNAIPITSHTAAESNVYISATIDTSASGQFQSDCGDLRFTTVGGDILPYYIVSGCVSASTVVHVFFKSMPAGAQTIYYYYGNPSAANGFSSSDFSTQAANYAVGSIGSQEKGGAPIAYWKFDDGTGTNAQDSSPNNNDGTLTGATWQTEDQCISGKCLKFDGTDDYVTKENLTGNMDFDEKSVISISLWAKATGGANDYLLELPETSGSQNGAGIRFDSNVIYYHMVTHSANSFTDVSTSITQGEWYNFALTYDGTTLKGYKNGQLIGSQSVTLGTGIKHASKEINVGRLGTWGGNFNGFIDDVKIYNYARTAAQIKSDFKSRGTAKGSSASLGRTTRNSEAFSEGLVGYWKMDENTGATVADASGNSGTQTFGATAPTWVSGEYGAGLQFDGANSGSSTPNSTALNITGTQISYGAWVYVTATPASYGIIIQKGGNPTGYRLMINSIGYATAQISGAGSVYSSSAVTQNTWVYLFTTYDGIKMSMYVNGVLQGSGTAYSSSIGDSSSYGLNLGKTEYPPITGKIDEARVYNRALSPREVRDLYSFAPGPVGYWNLDEGSGLSAKDSSGNGNTGVITAATWKNGKYGGGLLFNGSTTWVETTLTPAIPASRNYTQSLWFYPTSAADGILIDDYNRWEHYIQMNSNRTVKACYYDSSTVCATSTNTITLNTWNHVAAVIDSGNSINVYVNGVLWAQNTSLGGIQSRILNDVVIGAGGNTHPTPFTGTIDDVRIYNYARNSKQIVEDMNAGHPAGGSPVGSQVGYWKMDEGYGTTAFNAGNTGATLNGTLGASAAAPTWSNNGKFGKALSFDGGDYINIPDDSSVNFVNKPFTISIWAHKTGSFGGSYVRLVDKSQAGTANGYGFDISNSQLRLLGTTNLAVSYTMPTGSWTHLVATYDGASTGTFYVNGKLQGTGTYTSTNTWAGILRIGTDSGGGSLYIGLIDEVKIYNSALTSDEIQLDYNRGQAMVLGTLSDTSGVSGGSVASSAASALYCIPGDTATCTPPIAEWSLDEGSGNSVNDVSGNGYIGTWNGSSNHWVDGILGKAGNFSTANGDYVGLGTTASLTPTSLVTAEAWIYPTRFPTQGSERMGIIGRNYRTPWQMSLWESGQVVWGYTMSDGTSFDYKSVGSPLTLNQWNFVAITHNVSTGQLISYINGKQTTYTAIYTGTLVTPSGTATIGSSGGSSQIFQGKIDRPRIFDYVRTPAQIALDYNQGKPIAQWKMDECQGASVFDASGNGNTGTITIGATGTQTAVGTCTTSGTAWYNGVTGKFNSSLNFDGTDDYVSASLFPSVTYNGTYSFSAWIKPTNNSGTQTIFQNSNSGSDRSGMIYETDNVKFGYYNGTAWYGVAGPITAGSWYHVVGVNNQTSLILYINGIPKTTSSSPYVGSGGFLIGRTSTVGQYNYFNGQVDDVRIYNYALTPLQIRLLFNGSSAVRFGPQTGSP